MCFHLNISCGFKTFATCAIMPTDNLITWQGKGTINRNQHLAIKIVTESGLIFHYQLVI
jgi:hypothetical protein